MAKRYVPERGDIVFTDFNPSAGKEQALSRPAIVLSPHPFNDQIELALVAPITSTVRGHGFEVQLENMKTTGVVLCQQVRTIDYQSRGISFIEKAPEKIVKEVLARVKVLVN